MTGVATEALLVMGCGVLTLLSPAQPGQPGTEPSEGSLGRDVTRASVG